MRNGEDKRGMCLPYMMHKERWTNSDLQDFPRSK